jgi:serpin B
MKKIILIVSLISIVFVFLFASSSFYAENHKINIIPDTEADNDKFKTYKIGDSDIEIPLAENVADVLNKLGLFKGTGSGYELKKPVTRAEAITMVLRMIGEDMNGLSDNLKVGKFDDVNRSHWAFDKIEYSVEKGYINGTSETTFDPERGVTGQEFIKMLLSAMGYEKISIENAYESGINYGLLVNNYAKLAVSTKGYQLLRNDVVNICYLSLLSKTSDGKFLKDILIEKEIVDEQELNNLILSENTLPSENKSFAWELNDYMPSDQNYMFSPLSIKMALAMAAVGADGETKDEILKVLKIDNLDIFNEFSKRIIKEYSENKKVNLNIANSLWLNNDYCSGVDFEDEYKKVISDYYDAKSEEINNANAVEKVNGWVNDKTKGKITELISDSDFLAYIVNAIYFKGEWAVQFNEGATQKAEFTDRSGKKTEIDFMHHTGYFDYYEDSHVQMLKLPYKDGKTSMYIAIPSSKGLDFDKNIGKMQQKRVQISLPKFETEFSIELIETLSKMGIQTAFNPNKADFKKMFTETTENVFISDVIHKTFINVDETGTEAAAVTGIGFSLTSVPIDEPVIFNANKPFTYFIRDDVNDEILFIGEYAY